MGAWTSATRQMYWCTQADQDDTTGDIDLFHRPAYPDMVDVMNPILKHIPPRTVLTLADEVGYQPGQIVSKTLVQNSSHSLTLFAFDKGEEISTHEAGGDALVTVLEGTGQVTIDGVPYVLSAGQSIVMPAGAPHAVLAPEPFKMSLLVVMPHG